nr:uncharacterized protein LOC112709215 [Arachis hypogaea]
MLVQNAAQEEYFAARVKTRIKQLKTQLRTLKKHGSTVTEYMAKINQVTDSLKALGAPLSREDYIEAALAGLGEEYNTFVTVATARIDHTTESELETQLLTQEELIERFRKTELGAMQVNVAQSNEEIQENSQRRNYSNYNNRGGFRGSRGRRQYRGGGSRSSWWQGSRPQCQLCDKIGHTVIQCYHRFDQDFMNPHLQPLNTTQPPSFAFYNNSSNSRTTQKQQQTQNAAQPASQNSQALLTVPSAMPDTAWYPDSGASHHCTYDARNLATGTSYDGTEQVFGGNGQDIQKSPPPRTA